MLIFIFIQFIFPFLLPGFIFISFCFCSVWGPNKLTGTQTPVAATTKTGTSPVRKAGGWKTKGMGAKASQLDWLDCRDTSGLESQQRERGGGSGREKDLSFQVLCVCPRDSGDILSCVFELPAVLISLPGVELAGQNYPSLCWSRLPLQHSTCWTERHAE